MRRRKNADAANVRRIVHTLFPSLVSREFQRFLRDLSENEEFWLELGDINGSTDNIVKQLKRLGELTQSTADTAKAALFPDLNLGVVNENSRRKNRKRSKTGASL